MDFIDLSDTDISRRLKHALVADLVMEDLSDAADHWLLEPMRDEMEWTEHFGRQLGMRSTYGSGGIHDTLIFILRELDDRLRNWPPLHDLHACREMSHEATKHLAPLEILATLLAGPSRWRQEAVEVKCTVEHLDRHLQPILERVLATELNRVITAWVEWDIRQLRERRKEAVARRAAAEAAERSGAARSERERPDPKDRHRRLDGFYTPKGKT